MEKQLTDNEPKKQTTTVPATPWSFFFYISNQHYWWMWGAILSVILASGASAGLSYFFKLIIDAVEVGNVEAAFTYGLLFPVAVLVVQLLYRVSGWCGMHWTILSNRTAFDVLTNYVFAHSHTYFSNRFAGSVTNKFRNVTGAFDQIIPDFLWGQLNSLVAFLITFILIAQVDSKTALMFVLLLVLLIAVNQMMVGKKKVLAKTNAEAGTAMQGWLVDTLSNISMVRQYTMQDYERQKLSELSLRKQTTGFKNWGYTEIMLTLNSLVLFVCALGMFWFLVEAWSLGRVSTGDFVLVLALVSNITGTLLFVGRAFNSLARVVGELEEALEDIITPHEIVDAPKAIPLTVTSGTIEFSKVTFSFGENSVFSNFTLQVPGRQRVGVVGSSGAGKSTLVALLLRQFDVQAGEIRVDGQDIKTVTQDSLRGAVAVVPQEPSLFHRSIKENIAYLCGEVSIEEVQNAAKSAQAHDFICALPEGYDTIVGERGVKLSGGQRQRIAIARAILKNAPILILDEATSALDSESEVAIQKALHNLMQGKTVIAIAHRLSTLREMDRIVVLQDGVVREDGTHEELTVAGGQYASLWHHQAGGFLLEK